MLEMEPRRESEHNISIASGSSAANFIVHIGAGANDGRITNTPISQNIGMVNISECTREFCFSLHCSMCQLKCHQPHQLRSFLTEIEGIFTTTQITNIIYNSVHCGFPFALRLKQQQRDKETETKTSLHYPTFHKNMTNRHFWSTQIDICKSCKLSGNKTQKIRFLFVMVKNNKYGSKQEMQFCNP